MRITLHRIHLDAFYALFDGFALPTAATHAIGWTREAEEMLTRLWLQGAHIDDICTVLDKPNRHTIWVRRQLLGLPPRRKGIRRDALDHRPLTNSALASLHQELRRAM